MHLHFCGGCPAAGAGFRCSADLGRADAGLLYRQALGAAAIRRDSGRGHRHHCRHLAGYLFHEWPAGDDPAG